ncbi:hypothetical protein [Pedobacter insulae]|uniref:Uncharacterized protein n=1 Tax=Pedobacter insulae TaxID=414048 RepID=A0A1I2W3N8_9SPHI|nr:hypothetical protein [Pedobacter insulae]SFG94121.1 hypothetical protein SAMN04489864_103348 [Pedobacter insulae]
MKKVLFSLVAISFLATTIISCQSNQKGTAESDADSTKPDSQVIDTTATQAKTTSENKVKSILDVSPTVKVKTPQFSSEEVNEGFEKFEPIKQAYIAAINSKDAVKIKDVTAEYWKWVESASTWGKKLTKDENQIYIDHYTKLVSQWDQLTPKVKK